MIVSKQIIGWIIKKTEIDEFYNNMGWKIDFSDAHVFGSKDEAKRAQENLYKHGYVTTILRYSVTREVEDA